MKRFSIYIAALMFCSILGVGCINENDDSNDDVKNYVVVGDAVPEFQVADADGQTFHSAQFKGKRSLLVFYIVACEDCRRALPVVQAVYDEFLNESEMYNVILISRQDAAGDIEEYWREKGYTMHSFLDPDRSVYGLFANKMVPRLYIIDEDGVVEWMAIESFDETAEELISMIRD